ncbi:MAG: HEAT repeat domain-containing protein [Planctomycetes bacterium]|nr:HEAT repeat domain-containing protein [Planctomycetota bacterium]
MKRFAGFLPLFLAVALVAGCGSVDKTVTQKPGGSLTADQIKAKLTSGKFSEKLEARKQLEKLPPADRLSLLTGLLGDPKPANRLVAVTELKKLSDPKAKEALQKTAAGDADAEVRAAAK